MNEKELENLLEAYTETIRAVCRKYFLIGGNEDDLFQEGMIGLLEACRDFDKSKGDFSSSAFKKFALVCIRRQIYDAIKHANTQKNKVLNTSISLSSDKNQREKFDFDTQFDEFAEINLRASNPEEILLTQESFDEQLKLLTQKLSQREQEVLELYLDGLPQSKIAKVLNKSVKQVDNTIQRIKKKCKTWQQEKVQK